MDKGLLAGASIIIMDRIPAVSGLFYPSDRGELIDLLEGMNKRIAGKGGCDDPIGVMVPHAGFTYSGVTAMYAYKEIARVKGRKFVIIGPNHSSLPQYGAAYPEGSWITPLGKTGIDHALAEMIVSRTSRVKFDSEAHSAEHSIEVQIPFLQQLFGTGFSFVPILLGDQSYDATEEIARVIGMLEDDLLFIASSDLTHYEPDESAREKDNRLLGAIESLDVKAMYRTIIDYDISACGYGAIAILMHITKMKGGTIRLLDHRTSGDASGERSSVVGYGSMLSCRHWDKD